MNRHVLSVDRFTERFRPFTVTVKSVALASVVCMALVGQSANAGIMPGVLDDFEDGTLGGWAPPAGNTSNVPGGPVGSTRALEIRSAGRLAAFDAGADIAGVIDPSVVAIEVDMSRSASAADPLEIRLVLFGPGTANRWTSTQAQLLPADGLWRTYSFSILESDLTQVAGGNSYSDLTSDLNRIMFRHNSGAPSAVGTPVSFGESPFFIDNVTAVAVPEPGSLVVVGMAGLLSLAGVRRR